MAHKKLKDKDIDKQLLGISEWSVNSKKTLLSKKFDFTSFINGLSFIAKITVHAEIMNHHPEIELSNTGVKVKLSTHSVKGLSKADFDLAKRIDNLRLG